MHLDKNKRMNRNGFLHQFIVFDWYIWYIGISVVIEFERPCCVRVQSLPLEQLILSMHASQYL